MQRLISGFDSSCPTYSISEYANLALGKIFRKVLNVPVRLFITYPGVLPSRASLTPLCIITNWTSGFGCQMPTQFRVVAVVDALWICVLRDRPIKRSLSIYLTVESPINMASRRMWCFRSPSLPWGWPSSSSESVPSDRSSLPDDRPWAAAGWLDCCLPLAEVADGTLLRGEGVAESPCVDIGPSGGRGGGEGICRSPCAPCGWPVCGTEGTGGGGIWVSVGWGSPRTGWWWGLATGGGAFVGVTSGVRDVVSALASQHNYLNQCFWSTVTNRNTFGVFDMSSRKCRPLCTGYNMLHELPIWNVIWHVVKCVKLYIFQ